MERNLCFAVIWKAYFLCFDTLDVRNSSVGLLIDGIVKRMISPTCWPLPGLHTSIIKGKNICAFFAIKYHLSHFFLPVQAVLSLTHHGIPLSYVDCTFYITYSCKFSFVFFQWLCNLKKWQLGPSSCRIDLLWTLWQNIQSLLLFTPSPTHSTP